MCNRLIQALLVTLAAIVATPATHAVDGDSGALCAIVDDGQNLTPATSGEKFVASNVVTGETAVAGGNAVTDCFTITTTRYTCTCLNNQRVRKIVERWWCCGVGPCDLIEVVENSCTGTVCPP
jgi:hypothetical protein